MLLITYIGVEVDRRKEKLATFEKSQRSSTLLLLRNTQYCSNDEDGQGEKVLPSGSSTGAISAGEYYSSSAERRRQPRHFDYRQQTI